MSKARKGDLLQAGGLYRYHAPYGPDICVYCGDPAGTLDHVTPLVAVAALMGTVDVRRHYPDGLCLVPSCADCNCRLSSFLARSIDEKREELKRRLRRKHAQLLNSRDWQPEELEELGHSLRALITQQERKRAWLIRRLAFPKKPK